MTRIAGRAGSDAVVYLGLNRGAAAQEIEALRGRARLVPVGGTSPGDDEARIAGRRVALSTREDVRAFAASLGLDDDRTAAVAGAIERADHDGRDDLARLARVWAAAERGGSGPSRLVL